MPQPLTGKRILVTQSDAFMGPAIGATLKAQGAHVIALVGSLIDPEAPGKMVAEAGAIDEDIKMTEK